MQSEPFSESLYPREALQSAAAAFSSVCEVRLTTTPVGTVAELDVPEGGDRDALAEFANIALVTAIDLFFSSSKNST